MKGREKERKKDGWETEGKKREVKKKKKTKKRRKAGWTNKKEKYQDRMMEDQYWSKPTAVDFYAVSFSTFGF